MKKIIYAILILIIIAGIIIIPTIGLRADIIYSENVELDVYVGKTFDRKDIESIVSEVFPDERVIIQEIEMFNDMFSLTLQDNRSEDELNTKIEELNNKINEKYGTENTVDDISVTHNSRIRLSDILIPYAVTIGISVVVILVFVGVRYRKLGVIRTLITYLLSIGASELLLLSIIAITRFPINRLVIPVGLVLFVIVVTILGFKNESKLAKLAIEETSKKAWIVCYYLNTYIFTGFTF